jgi:DNA-binding transcriptional LysR family regulator
MWHSVQLRELRIFLALAEELHFRRTAERLRISQPSVSETVRILEAHLGGRLFDRTSRRVALTPAGQELRRMITPIMAAIDGALAHVSDTAAGFGGPLRIGFTATSQGPQLSRLAGEFQLLNPGCHVVLREVDIWDPHAALRHGDVDVLVNWLAIDEPDLTTGPALSFHRRILAVPPRHRLAGRTSVPVQDLEDEQVARLPASFPAALYDAILPPRTPSGRPIARTQPVRSINEIATYVAHGRIVHVTVTGVPLFLRDDIALVPIENLAPLPLGLIWSTARENAKICALADVAHAIGDREAREADSNAHFQASRSP